MQLDLEQYSSVLKKAQFKTETGEKRQNEIISYYPCLYLIFLFFRAYCY